MGTVYVQSDKPGVFAQRLTMRLIRDGLVSDATPGGREFAVRVTEALADEIHQAILEATIGGGA